MSKITVSGYNGGLADGVAVINLGSSKYAVLQIEDGVNVKWFGALGDGINIDNEEIQSAYNYAQVKRNNLFIPSGNYLMNASLTVVDYVSVIGESGTILTANSAMEYVIGSLAGNDFVSHFTIEKIWVEGAQLANHGFKFYKINFANSNLKNLRSQDCLLDGFHFVQCQGGAFYGLFSKFNTRNGFYIEGCNSAKFYGLDANQNGVGFYFYGASGYSGGNYTYGFKSEANLSHAVHIVNVTSPSGYAFVIS